jgi:hypothetical protein
VLSRLHIVVNVRMLVQNSPGAKADGADRQGVVSECNFLILDEHRPPERTRRTRAFRPVKHLQATEYFAIIFITHASTRCCASRKYTVMRTQFVDTSHTSGTSTKGIVE